MEDFNVYPEAIVEEQESDGADTEATESEEVEEVAVDVFLNECLQTHPVLCEQAPFHPLIRERNLEKYYWS